MKPLVAPVVLATLLGLAIPPPVRSAEPTSADGAIAMAKRRVQRSPRDPDGFLRLGDAYVLKARESGDLSYLSRAEQALLRSADIAPGRAAAWRHLAYVFSTRHEFEAAATHARKALVLDPADAAAYGVLGDALLELGDYAEAQRMYETMLRIEANLDSLSRMSGLKNLKGDTAGAIADLDLAIREAQANRRPRESIAWAQWQLGSEHFALGDLANAKARYHEALATYPNYHRAVAGLAQVRAAQERYLEAIQLYRRALTIVPLPEYAAALGDVYTRAGDAVAAKKQYDLVEYIGRLSALNRVLYNRELAYFYAERGLKLDEAVAFAREELSVRKDIYTYDVLAWSLYRAGRAAEALAPMEEALRLGTRDARLFFHAGMIHRALGDAGKARRHLERALATNPHFHVLHADTARQTLRDME